MSDGEESQSTSNTSTLKKLIKDYRSVDKEIRESAPLLTALRKRKRELHDSILEAMQSNGFDEVNLRDGNVVARFEKTVKSPVNAEHICGILEEYLQDKSQAAEVCSLIYQNRAQDTKQFINIVDPNKQKAVRRVVSGGATDV